MGLSMSTEIAATHVAVVAFLYVPGAEAWTKLLGVSGASTYGRGIATASSGDIFVTDLYYMYVYVT